MPTKPSVLAIDAKLFMDDVVPELEHRGFDVHVEPPQTLGVERFDALCDEHAPSFVLTVNYTPELALLSTRRSIPYVSWTVDPLPASRWSLLEGTRPELCMAFVHRRSLIQTASALGVASRHLPLAASPRRLVTEGDSAAEPSVSAPGERLPVSFVGRSLVDEDAALWRKLAEAQASAASQGALRTWIETASAQEPLPSELLAGLPSIADLEDAIAGSRSHHLRRRRVLACRDQGVSVWGDPGWAFLEGGFRGPADHGAALTDIYRRTLVNLDIPRAYQHDIVTMRVFDIMAAGGVVVCEPSPDLAALFDVGKHLLTYTDEETLVDRVQTLLVDHELRRDLVRHGRAHVVANHLVKHRVDALLVELRDWLHVGP